MLESIRSDASMMQTILISFLTISYPHFFSQKTFLFFEK